MQGPRLSSHYHQGVPNLALHRPTFVHQETTPSASPTRGPASDHASKPNASTGTSRGVGAGETGQERAGGGRGPDIEEGKGGDLPATPLRRLGAVLKRHVAFVGPGVVASVAYLDPGNWATDLAAGSSYGYSHLFIILLSGLIALLFQIQSTRLGSVSDYDLATHCRFALYDRPGRFKLFYRYALLWPLYLIAEAGIIFTDLAELLGSAIAINLVIPQIPLYGAVILTSLDVFLVLLLFNQYPARTVTNSMRCFELLIGLLVLTVLGSFVALLVRVSPTWKDVFHGYVPSSGIVRGGGIYIAVGIIGATVMPHAFFIGSKMATMRRLKPSEYGESDETAADRDVDDFEPDGKTTSANNAAQACDSFTDSERGRASQRLPPTRTYFPSLHLPQPLSMNGIVGNLATVSRARSRSNSPAPARYPPPPVIEEITVADVAAEGEEDDEGKKRPMDDVASVKPLKQSTRGAGERSKRSRPMPSLACINAHLGHAVWDIAGSLLGFAVVVNSSILILGAAVFYYGPYRTTNPDGVSDLFDAYALVKDYLGQSFAYLFAVALLAAGQSASLTVTLSGQIVSEGFLNWRTKPWKRRIITRTINIVPSVVVAAAVGRDGIDTLLIASQVALSIVLTFVLLPLIIATSLHSVMAVPIHPAAIPPPPPAPSSTSPPTPLTARLASFARILNPFRRRNAPEGYVSFASPVWAIWLQGMLYALICIANVYALYDVSTHGA